MAPQSNSKKSLINMDNDSGICGTLNRTFYWFDREITTELITANKQFLRTNLYYSLMGITNKPLAIWKGNDYFVTQIDLAWDCPLHIKTSNIAAQVILDNALGKNSEIAGDLDLKNITELEARILTGYNEFLFQKIAGIFRDKRELEELQAIEGTRKNLTHLTYFIYSDLWEQEEAGKVIIAFPEYAIEEPALLSFPEKPIDILQYQDSCTRTDVFVGKSKISLSDLKHLEMEDIVVLEKSNIHFMTIKGDEEVTFSVNPDPRLAIGVDNSAGGTSMNNQDNNSMKNIWDNLQVEVSAEFKKIKISLGELRQITEGLVVDIASIVQNEIVLHVDGEKIASGELVIIGDKYGVKITKVFPETKYDKEMMVREIAAPKKAEEEVYEEDYSSQETSEDEDFDYSDFEIEEEI